MTGRRNLPVGWMWAHFDDVASIESDLVEPTNHPDAPHIAPNHIESKTGRLLPYATVAADKVTSPKHRFRAGQILYSKIRPYLAKAVLVEFEGLCSADMYPVSTSLEPRFLLRWLLSDEFTARVSLDQGRTVLPKVNQAALGKIDVPVPPLNEQRRIVAKLEALLARSRRAKEALDAIPALLERFRQSVLAAAFRGDLTRDWRAANPDVEPASKLLERIRSERRRRWEEAELERMRARGTGPRVDRRKTGYEEPTQANSDLLSELPDSWCWASADEVAEIAGGLTKNGSKRDKASTRVPLVSVAAVQLRRIEADAIGTIGLLPEDGDKGTLQRNDLLLVEGNGSLSHIGRVALWDVDVEGARHQNHIIRLRPFVLSSSFLLEWLASPAGRAAIIEEATSATGLYTLSLSKVGRLPVPLPPLEEQAEITQRIERAMRPITEVEALVAEVTPRLSNLESTMLAKAFAGKLVPQDPADEPASVLLQRIRAERDKPADNKTNPRPKRRRETKVA